MLQMSFKVLLRGTEVIIIKIQKTIYIRSITQGPRSYKMLVISIIYGNYILL